MEIKNVRTRFAPSPTGFMHLGVLRTALYAWVYAKKHNGSFILRIEDTDQKRYVEGAVEFIYDTLKECGLNWNEGPDIGGNFTPYIQSERKDLYIKYAEELIQKDMAYYCFCPPEAETCNCRGEQRSPVESPFVIRQKTPQTGQTSFKDEIYGEITVENSEIEDQIIIKSDGLPTYNFANVIDDHLMNITHIIRGNEFLSSTPKHVLLYQAFGWIPPVYIHCSQIMRDANHKLSKRDGDAYFSDFKSKGYLTEAILNYIALLGWSPKGENEIFSLEEFSEAFDVNGISKSPAIFDEVKMRAINASYIRNLPLKKFKEIARPFIGEYDIDYDILCAALQPRTEVLTDITPQVDFLEKPCEYNHELYYNKKMKTSPETAIVAFSEVLAILETYNFTKEELFDEFKKITEQTNEISEDKIKVGFYLYPLQIALTGKSSAPGGGLDICVMLGREESLKRIKAAIEKIEKLKC
ncbi:MAG: glutamate--tRNA ligase [Oscillospiraceae bacterium]|nr:glutamate--tRNA ligase [Oscillospiraceae bacterium]